ncbi:MAG: YceI family protein [Verrucomicrobia bacterium]|nr:YceI family protein [Verrucomicrobiota bacterium]
MLGVHMKIVGVLFFWLLCKSLTFGAEQYVLDGSHSEINFRVRQFLTMVTGKFTDLSGTVTFDSEQPDRSQVEATIPVKTIDTGITTRDHHLLASDFFDAEKFPTISFKSTSVKLLGATTADVRGDLTMHGRTLPVIIHVELLSTEKKPGGALSWKVTAHLRRSDFGLRWNPVIEAASGIGNDVEIQMRMVTPARKD